MSHKEYQLFNVIVAGLLFALFIISLLANQDSPMVSCLVLERTGEMCGSCGLTRDFISFSHLNFDSPINSKSKFVYVWFLGQFFFRTILTFYPNTLNSTLKKVDLVVSIISGIFVFLSLWI